MAAASQTLGHRTIKAEPQPPPPFFPPCSRSAPSTTPGRRARAPSRPRRPRQVEQPHHRRAHRVTAVAAGNAPAPTPRHRGSCRGHSATPATTPSPPRRDAHRPRRAPTPPAPRAPRPLAVLPRRRPRAAAGHARVPDLARSRGPLLRRAPHRQGRAMPTSTLADLDRGHALGALARRPRRRDPDAVSPSPSAPPRRDALCAKPWDAYEQSQRRAAAGQRHRPRPDHARRAATPAAAWWPRCRHPSRATLDAVTTVTLLPRPRAVHH